MQNWNKLSYLKKEDLERIQSRKLRQFIRYKIPFSPYYSQLFKKAGIKFSDIKTTADLKKIPFTEKEDIAPKARDPAKPRDFILQPSEQLIKQIYSKPMLLSLGIQKFFGTNIEEKLENEFKPIHIHFTTGRTASPTPFLYSQQDIKQLKEAGKRMMEVFGISKDNIAINAFPYAPHLAFWQTFFGLNTTNILSLHTGGGKITGTEKICKAIEAMKATMLIAMPGYAYHLVKEASESKMNFNSLKYVILGGERVPAGMKDKIKELLMRRGAKNPKVLSTYAFTEGKVAWSQCCEDSGYHLYPDMEFIEVVDNNGNVVEEGEKGEIVYTALDWRGTAVLRYKTGDLGVLEKEKCEFCGRTVPRIKQNIERKSEYKEFRLTKVKGELINLNAFYPLLSGHKAVKEWQIELKKKNNDPFELDELYVYIAPKSGIDFEKLKAELARKIKDETNISPTKIIKADEKSLAQRLGMETELKEKRILDKRP